MPDIVIKAENLGKKYNLGSAVAGDLRSAWGNFFRKIRAGNDLSGSVEDHAIWALRDINFEIKRGDAVGIIGPNGAGKSTLLKILSRITHPTTGKFFIDGRVSSLLEVGTGFHMELTGRENIFLNGTILGMKRNEIRKKFDEIIAFSGVEKFIDTPVKRYSSGMQVRLAFSVAAHLEPEILIVDEVLAVGDAEFQKKCIGKMENVTGEGRTVLFVSHNMPTVKSLCKTGILLKSGKVIKSGLIEEIIDRYTTDRSIDRDITEGIHYFQPTIKIYSIYINGNCGNNIRIQGGRLEITVRIEFLKRTTFEMDVHIKKFDVILASYANFVQNEVRVLDPGRYILEYHIDISGLKSGNYTLDLFFTEPFTSWLAVTENMINLELINSGYHTFLNTPSLKWGAVILNGECRINPETTKGNDKN